MSSEAYEMDDLSENHEKQPQGSNTAMEGSISSWAWASAILLALLSSCLVLFPRFLLFLSESAPQDERRTNLTPLESFLAVQFGIWLSAVAAALVLNIPDGTSAFIQTPISISHPLLGSLTAASSLNSFIAWNAKDVGSLSTIVSLASGTIGLWGLWVVVFGASQSVSKTTGADKHTSAFIFGNKNAASVQKKDYVESQLRRRR